MPSVARSLALLLAAVGASCASSARLVSTWRDPAPVGPFEKLLILVVTNDVAFRRIAEDDLARRLAPASTVASYTLLNDAETKDRDRIRAAVEAAGADAVLVCRVVDIEKKTTIVGAWPYPQHYRTFGDYCSYAWPVYWDPGYVREDETVEVETLLYARPSDSLVFAATSKVFNPASPRDLMTKVAATIGEVLRKERLLR